MSGFTIQVRCINTAEIIAECAMSSDACAVQRRDMAEEMAMEKGVIGWSYAVEIEHDETTPKGHPGRLKDKYELAW